MSLVATVNHQGQGVCYGHEDPIFVVGRIITGSANVLTNGMQTAQMNSIVQASCGHVATLIGTTKNLVNGLPIGTMGSQFQGIYIGSIINGSANVRSQ